VELNKERESHLVIWEKYGLLERDIRRYKQVLFHAMVTFLKHVAQIKRKIAVQNSVFLGGWVIDNLFLYNVTIPLVNVRTSRE
jgi:hypothetical protein